MAAWPGQALVPVPARDRCAFTTIDAGALALTRFSRFLGACHPEVGEPSAITRPVLEDYLSWLVTEGYSASTRALSLSMIRVFFDACHRHGWLPGLAANATIYVEELPFHHDEIARFIPEQVMAQLESDEAVAKIPRTTTRNLVVVMMETGLRGEDACTLPFNSAENGRHHRSDHLSLPLQISHTGTART